MIGKAQPVYNIELVRSLCQEISAEKDEARAQELMFLLKAVLEEDQEEIRVRLGVLHQALSYRLCARN